MGNLFLIILAATVIMSLMVLTTLSALAPPSTVSACQTNANGCIKNGGPGNSFESPAEVSGCHVFPPVGECAKDTTH